MKPFAYARATTVEEVVAALDTACRPLAGGTDLIGLMKENLAAPARLVDVKSILGLDAIDDAADGLHTGAAVTLSKLADALEGRADVACLRGAIVEAASPQLRHMATIAGNLVQQPRCWYYRNKDVPCWRKGGSRCFAVQGDNTYHTILGRSPCNAVHPSDPAVALLALGAEVKLVGPSGVRQMPLGDFYRLPGRVSREDNVLAEHELITEIVIPPQPEGARCTYVKVAERSSWDFALASAAVSLVMDGDRVQSASVALGGVAPVPWRAEAAEQALVGQTLSDGVISVAAEAATEGARAMSHNAYKIDLVQGAVKAALRRLV